MEQIAIIDVASCYPDAAGSGFQAILEGAALSRGLRGRAPTFIVALGAELETGTAGLNKIAKGQSS